MKADGLEKPSKDLFPVFTCDSCKCEFAGRYIVDPGSYGWAACEKCSSVVLFGSVGDHGLLDWIGSSFDQKNIAEFVKNNLCPCPQCQGNFKTGSNPSCPECNCPLGDWVWAYPLINTFGLEAFHDSSEWKDYEQYAFHQTGRPDCGKRIIESAVELFRQGRLRDFPERPFEVQNQLLSTRPAYKLEDVVKKGVFIEALGNVLFNGRTQKRETPVLLEQYFAAFWIAKLSGSPFEFKLNDKNEQEKKVLEWQSWWTEKRGKGVMPNLKRKEGE